MFANTLPRRAVIVDGLLAEKRDHPGSREIEAISKLCETLANGRAPRFTTELVRAAIETNDPYLWKTACDDVATGDFDAIAVNAMFSADTSLPPRFAMCLLSATDHVHVIHVMMILRELTKTLGEESIKILGQTLSYDHKRLFDSFSNASSAARSVRDALIEEFAKIVVPFMTDETVLEALRLAIATRKYELVGLFANADVKLTKTDAAKLVDSAKKASFVAKTNVVALIARLADEDPDAFDRETLRNLVRSLVASVMTNDYVDERLALAIGRIASKCHDDDDLVSGLATMLSWSAARNTKNDTSSPGA